MIAAAPTRATITIRPAQPEDQGFVASTFVEQLVRGNNPHTMFSDVRAVVASDPKYRHEHVIVDRVLDSETTRVLVATDHAGRIVGWLAYAAIPRVRAVLFAYVRNKQRLAGVAHQLVAAAWPHTRPWVHGGLRGSSTRSLLGRFRATEMALEDLL